MEPTSPKKFPVPAVAGAIVGLVILAGVGFILIQEKNESAGGAALSASADMKTKKTFKDLLGAGEQRCTFEQSSDLSRSTGTFYTANGKGRMDSESTVLSGPGAGTVARTYMIIDGDMMYMWDETTGQGMKMAMSAIPEQDGSASVPENSPAQWNQEYDYDCDGWNPDPKLFVLPNGVEFMDMNALMQGMGGGMPMMETGALPAGSALPNVPANMGDMMAAQCAACEQAGDARAQCRAALGCR